MGSSVPPSVVNLSVSVSRLVDNRSSIQSCREDLVWVNNGRSRQMVLRHGSLLGPLLRWRVRSGKHLVDERE